MKIDAHGIKQINGEINPLLFYLENKDDLQRWNYMGLKVEIDPTVDHNNQNILVRWVDIDEGFNDKIIVNNLNEFNLLFSLLEND